MERRTKTTIFVTAVAVGVVCEVRLRQKVAEQTGQESVNRATAYYGAMTLYGHLASYFGKRAMMAETEYWKAVRHGT